MLRFLMLAVFALACDTRRSSPSFYQAPYAVPSVTAQTDCKRTIEVAPLRQHTEMLPGRVSVGDAFDALTQFLVLGGNDIDTKDASARTITTRRFVGQTITTTCGINHYRSYALRAAIVGRALIVTMDCFGSTGWESYVGPGGAVIPGNRGTLTPCNSASVPDATIPRQIAEGTLTVLGLASVPSSVAPRVQTTDPRADTPWWCFKATGIDFSTCEATIHDCDESRRHAIENLPGGGAVTLGPCQWVDRVVCHSWRLRNHDRVSRTCALTIEQCTGKLELTRMETGRLDYLSASCEVTTAP